MNVRKMLLLLMLALSCLMLTACYQDMDPWPASAGSADQPRDTATLEPIPAPTTTQTAPVLTAEPLVTIAPDITLVPDMWGDEPTKVPGGSMEPGFNG